MTRPSHRLTSGACTLGCVLGSVLLPTVSCQVDAPPNPATPVDAGPEPFDGDTVGGGVPVYPDSVYDAGVQLIDAGPVEPDTTCCEQAFVIDDVEPENASGHVIGDLDVFGDGLVLQRADGVWSAAVCFPVLQSSTYVYEFTWSEGQIEVDRYEREDGTIEIVMGEDIRVVRRASDRQPSFSQADGSLVNFQAEIASCTDDVDSGDDPPG